MTILTLSERETSLPDLACLRKGVMEGGRVRGRERKIIIGREGEKMSCWSFVEKEGGKE